MFLRYIPVLSSPEFRTSQAAWPKTIRAVLKGLSPVNDYLIDEMESFITSWPGKKWEIEKTAPTMENPPIISNFFDRLEEKIAAVEDQLVAHAETRQRAEEEARLRAEEVEG